MKRECSNCGSTKELVSDVVIKSDHFYDMRGITTICGNCFWCKSNIRTYANEKIQKEAEEPFIKHGKKMAEWVNKGMDDVILKTLGVR